MGLRRRGSALACLLWLAGAAQADEFDTLNFDFGLSRQADSNLFRLSAASAANPQATVGRSSAADTITTTSAGVRFGKTYSLQRIEAQVGFVDYKYSNFDFLSFTAANYKAAWKWSLTPRLKGELLSDRSEALNSFLDFRTFVRNIRRDQTQRASATYEIDGVWRVFGSLAHVERTNSQPFLEDGDTRSVVGEAGLRYVARSGSQWQVLARRSDGEFFKRPTPLVVSLTDNRFRQQEYEARVTWLLTGKSTLSGRMAHIDRSHPNFPQRDFRGVVGGADATWSISGKSRVSAGVSRELAAFPISGGTSFIRSDRWYVGPVWDATAKVQARARFDELTRSFLGEVGPVGQGRVETIRSVSLGVDWQPHRAVTLSAQWQNDRRTANLPGLDFNSQGTTLSAQLTF